MAGGKFINIDRFSGARLGEGASGPNVVAEYFREGEEPIFGLGGLIDGGFAMGGNLPLFAAGEDDLTGGRTVTTVTGKKVKVAPKATIGTLSSGGLY
jgi:penicillin-binding protein 1A